MDFAPRMGSNAHEMDLFVSVSVDEKRYAYYAMSGEHPDPTRALQARANADTLDPKGE